MDTQESTSRSKGGFFSRLARIPGSTRLVPELESLRFVAIASVFATHLNGYLLAKSPTAWARAGQGSLLDRIFQEGGFGVQLFFVISGFVLALPFASARLDRRAVPPLGAYYLRRLTRLEPPYLACLAILFAAEVLYNHASPAVLAPHLLASALYLHARIYHAMSPIDPVTWSLEVEIQFYLLAPALTLVFNVRDPRTRRILLAAACLLFQGAQAAMGWTDNRSDASLLNYLPYFLMGFLLVDLHLAGLLGRKGAAPAWDIVSIVGWPLLIAAALGAPAWTPWFLPWSLLLLVFAFFRGSLPKRALSGVVPVTLGGMCYSLYLFHQTLISMVARFTDSLSVGDAYLPNFLAQGAICAAVVILLTSLFFAMVERPCMRRDWPQRLMARLSLGAPVGGPRP